uniref:ATP synthase F0 subunit 8 n=1 Tax=Thraustotheca clavata TaxID=74557 RepID=S5TZ35_9STRA|nr:ATP synthase F0 subunit 8 [Thraustotheca clavata]AGS55525.1 ATP synthase F0 subunit 8 [Thraustotheca clavata]
MPQFDHFSFFNQVIFFLFFFFSFYFFISYYFLPQISTNIKFRKKIINSKLNEKNLLNLEINNKKISYTNLFKNFNNYYETILNENVKNYNINKNEYLSQNLLINLVYIDKIKNLYYQKFILSKKYLYII